uniref:Uncharacterized protein n=1 Tax=candidate division CPR3 bacterium TaxID=2268181 RepID=A0A7C4M2V0_UNCC3
MAVTPFGFLLAGGRGHAVAFFQDGFGLAPARELTLYDVAQVGARGAFDLFRVEGERLAPAGSAGACLRSARGVLFRTLLVDCVGDLFLPIAFLARSGHGLLASFFYFNNKIISQKKINVKDFFYLLALYFLGYKILLTEILLWIFIVWKTNNFIYTKTKTNLKKILLRIKL